MFVRAVVNCALVDGIENALIFRDFRSARSYLLNNHNSCRCTGGSSHPTEGISDPCKRGCRGGPLGVGSGAVSLVNIPNLRLRDA